jgi:short subunit fatty acids transporter
MHEKTNARRRQFTIDAFLVAVTLILLVVCLSVLMSQPTLWRLCLSILDIRGWTNGTWTGVGVALLACFLFVRLWPERKGRA